MEYYLCVNNEKRGPYTVNELAQRTLTAETLVMAEDTDRWVPAWQVEALRPYIQSSVPYENGSVTSSESAVPPPIDDVEEEASSFSEAPTVDAQPISGQPLQSSYATNGYQQSPPPFMYKPKKHHGCLWAFLVGVACLLALLVFTCPSTNQHKETLSETIAETVTDAAQADSLTDNDEINKVMQTIANNFTRKVVQTAVNNLLSVNNYVLFSVGKVHYANEQYVVSVGLLGHVFTVDKEDLKKATEKYYNEAQRRLEEQIKQQIQQNVTDPLFDFFGGAIKGLLNQAADAMGMPSIGVTQDKDDTSMDDADSI